MRKSVERTIRRMRTSTAGRTRRSLRFLVDRDVSYATIADVLYAATRAGFEAFAFRVGTADGADRTLRVETPEVCRAETRDREREPTCLRPTVECRSDGYELSVSRTRLVGESGCWKFAEVAEETSGEKDIMETLEDSDVTEAGRGSDRRQEAAGSGDSVRPRKRSALGERTAGTISLGPDAMEQLDSALEQLRGRGRACTRAAIASEQAMRWSTVAAAHAALQHRGGYERIAYTVAR